MARCTATPPCNYKANGEVHDPGCPARANYYPSNPELNELYATETAAERELLDGVLDSLLGQAGLDGDFDAADVTGGDAEWLTVRRVVRYVTTGDVTMVLDLTPVQIALEGDAPVLRAATP